MDDNADAKRILLASPPAYWRRQPGVEFYLYPTAGQKKVKEIIVLIKARSFLDELNLEHLTS